MKKEILTPNGDTYIPDRLLVGNEKTIILDYKTGLLMMIIKIRLLDIQIF